MEITPKEYRGFTGALNIVFMRLGIFFNYCLGFGLPKNANTNNQYWRVILLLPMVIAILHSIVFLCVFKDDTPTYVYLTT